MKSLLTSLFSLAVLCGCTSLGQLDSTARASRKGESIFVIGVSPPNHRVSVFPGDIDDGVFHQSLFLPAALYGSAKDGFVVGKASAGEVLAITNVRVVSDEDALIRGQNFAPCYGAKTFVFQVPKGKVIYIGSAAYFFRNEKLEVHYRNDFEMAKNYIDANYPELKGLLEYQEPQLLPIAKNCNPGPMFMPIYIKSK
ncbi:hypothetical protein [uncultured Herbaspirillum sp.]|uniref:hypothetical protein n=1 Tax=uncultured Herbaspirillum sp. TaxID=160236 RepID=UPI002589B8F6|nr:hypothetical protein [uncultured Herbaspirillum sp.]